MRKYVFMLLGAFAVLTLVYCGAGEEKPKALTSAQAAIEIKHRGTIWFVLYPDKAPKVTAQFIKLAKEGFYDGLLVYRISDWGFIQSGCPNNDGSGFYMDKATERAVFLKEEIDPSLRHKRGALSMMRFNQPWTTSSQFVICRKDVPRLDGVYSVIGEVVKGEALLDAMEKNDTIVSITIKGSYE